MSQKASWKDVEIMMKTMDQFFQQLEKVTRDIVELQRRRQGLDPKRKVKPKKQIEERKSTHFDFSFLHSFPMPESTKSKQIEPSKSISVVRETEKSKPEVANFSTMAKNVQEKEQQNSDFSEILPKEENVREEEQHESEFSIILEEEKSDPEVSNVVSMEQNVPEKKEYDSEFSDDSSIEQNVPGEGKRVSEFSLKENVHNSGEVIDFIFPMSTFIQTNQALDLRTNPFQEEEYDTILTSASINPSHDRAGPARRTQITEYGDGLNKLIREFWAKSNAWRPIELNYAQWGLFKAFRQLGTCQKSLGCEQQLDTFNLLGTLNEDKIMHVTTCAKAARTIDSARSIDGSEI